MTTQGAETNPGDVPAAQAPGGAASTGAGRLGPLWAWALAAGLVSGLVSWLVGEATFDRFQPKIVHPPGYDKLGPYDKLAALAVLHREQQTPVGIKKGAVAFGTLGAMLGLTLGLAGGLARRSARSGLVAAAVGLVAGAVAGAGMCAALTPVFYRFHEPDSPSLLMPVLVHAGMFAAIGAAAGLALGLGSGGRPAIGRAVLGGLAGGLLGTLAFEAIK